MNDATDVKVRTMTREELSLVIDWAAQEGWNPGIHDAECFYATDPHGFFLAEREGIPAGALSAVVYDDSFGFAGFYIVKPELRGRGVGHRLVQHASDYAGNRTVGSDAVVAQQDTYKSLGFHMAYRTIRHRGIASSKAIHIPGIIDLTTLPFSYLTRYDRRMFPAERASFLRCWITQPGATALGFMKDRQLAGYGVIRKCRQGHKIGPLFADNDEIADILLQSLTAAIPEEEFFLDIPEPNTDAAALASRYHMKKVFETARMYMGAAPSLPLERIFGVTSFELG